MGKLDKSQYTKAQWQAIRDRRRADKKAKSEIVEPAMSAVKPSDEKNYVLCLKHGTKYDFEYVNRLYSMVKRNLTLDFEFVCITDNTENLHNDIKTIPLPEGIEGWWCKPYMFNDKLPLNGKILYLDLDVVISENLDKFFTFRPADWCIIRDFTRCMRPSWKKYNSSVIRFNSGQLSHLWNTFKRNQHFYQRKHFGDQDYMYEIDKSGVYWPDEWVLSWKWEIRRSREFAPGGIRGKRKLRYTEDCTPPKDCSICVFHGDPNPHNCDDPWVKENWT